MSLSNGQIKVNKDYYLEYDYVTKMQKGGFLEEMVDYVRENNVPIESKGVVIEDLGMNESMTDYVDLDYYQDAILEARKKALKKSTKDRSFTSYGPKGNKM